MWHGIKLFSPQVIGIRPISTYLRAWNLHLFKAEGGILKTNFSEMQVLKRDNSVSIPYSELLTVKQYMNIEKYELGLGFASHPIRV